MTVFMTLALLCACGWAFSIAYNRASKWRANSLTLHSTPSYHGYFVVMCALAPMLITLLIGTALQANAYLVLCITTIVGITSVVLSNRFIKPEFKARNAVERIVIYGMGFVSFLAVLTTFSIFLALAAESLRFFAKVSPLEFLFGLQWSPQIAIREDQVGASGSFGVIPLITGTLLVTFIAMLVAVPLGVMSAVYLSEYASDRVHAAVKPVLELLAGVPTVVYGFFALLIVGPFVSHAATQIGEWFGFSIHPPAQNALAAGLVMGVMIIPFVSSLSDDVISAIPRHLREGGLAIGARKSEVITDIILPAAAPGLTGAFLLAISRAIGETMIVVMAASRSANLTGNPLERVTTITVQIVALLTGDQEFDSSKTLAAFALGLILFVTTLALNIVALAVVKNYRARYG